MILDLTLRGEDVVKTFEQSRGQTSPRLILSRGDEVMETFSGSADTIADTIGARGDALKEMLSARLQSFEEVFTLDGAAPPRRAHCQRLPSSLGKPDHPPSRRIRLHREVAWRRTGRAALAVARQTVSDTIRVSIDNFDSRIGNKNRRNHRCARPALWVRFQEALDSRTQTLNDALGGRVLET